MNIVWNKTGGTLTSNPMPWAWHRFFQKQEILLRKEKYLGDLHSRPALEFFSWGAFSDVIRCPFFIDFVGYHHHMSVMLYSLVDKDFLNGRKLLFDPFMDSEYLNCIHSWTTMSRHGVHPYVQFFKNDILRIQQILNLVSEGPRLFYGMPQRIDIILTPGIFIVHWWKCPNWRS